MSVPPKVSLSPLMQDAPRIADIKRSLAKEEEEEEEEEEEDKITQITTLLKHSVLTSGNARILIHSDHDNRGGGLWTNCPGGMTLLPERVRGIRIFAVPQTIHDVDFLIQFPTLNNLWFQIIYDPGSDDCLFVNHSSESIQLFRPGTPYTSFAVEEKESRSIRPGIWRVAVRPGSDGYDVFKFALNERLFNVSIYEANLSPTKRAADTDAEESTKRQRLGDNTTAEAIETQSTNGLTIEWESTDADLTFTREIVRKAAVPLLDLKDRETAAVEALHDTSSETYRLQRIRQLGHTINTSVFSCRHSGIPNQRLVVKVLRYYGVSALDLPQVVSQWKTEKILLENLKHRNIVSLEAFDGRMFALYLELLPLSLDRGLQSPFTKSDAHTILLDISSALSYLANLQIAHNDIKPGNIAYSPQRGAVLFDFGAACHLNKKPNIGTAWYLPPEFIENHGRGLPGDIWAMGVTMLYVLQKIGIPEEIAKNWDIGELFRAFEEENAAKVQMRGWLEFIAQKRAELDRKDGTGVENAVYQMLDGKRKLRAVAKDIVEVLRVTKEVRN